MLWPEAISREMLENLHDKVKGESGIWSVEELAEVIERGVPLECVLVEKGYPRIDICCTLLSSEVLSRRAHCSGARKARMAVCGSFSCRPNLVKGMCVSPSQCQIARVVVNPRAHTETVQEDQ